MNLETVRDMLAWCSVINIGVIMLWFLFFTLAHDWMYRFHARWYKVSVEQFDAIHYGGMALYKICFLIFNMVPYFALRIVG
jgi:hypothetical protein